MSIAIGDTTRDALVALAADDTSRVGRIATLADPEPESLTELLSGGRA
jgi:hypothetical protein